MGPSAAANRSASSALRATWSDCSRAVSQSTGKSLTGHHPPSRRASRRTAASRRPSWPGYGAPPAPGAQRPPQLRLGDHLAQRPCERLRVAGRHQKAGVFGHRVGDRARAGRDHRQAAGERLRQHHAVAFMVRSQHEQICPIIERARSDSACSPIRVTRWRSPRRSIAAVIERAQAGSRSALPTQVDANRDRAIHAEPGATAHDPCAP